MITNNVSDVIKNHVVLEVEGIDRIYLNGYQPKLQDPKCLLGFFKYHRGYPIVSTALMVPMTKKFVTEIQQFIKKNNIELVRFEKKERKDDVMKKSLKKFNKKEGILFVGVSQEKFYTFRSFKPVCSKPGRSFPGIYRSSVMCNQYYFYILDEDFGPMFIKFSSYFPYTMRVCINGHEYAKRQLEKEGIAYEPLDNGFYSCENPKRLQEILNELDSNKIEKVYRKWLSRLPHPFTSDDRSAGYRYELSILQIEFALTQVFDRPLLGRYFFEQIIRENIDLGRPDNVSLIFDRRVTKRTPGQFRTRIVTTGVIPSLHVSYKKSKIKQYYKEGQALRTETTINNTRDFGIGKKLVNLPAMREVGFKANKRLLLAETTSHDCMIGHEQFEQITSSVEVNGQRCSALKFGDLRVMSLLSAISLFIIVAGKFRNRELRQYVAQFKGQTTDDYSSGKMTYDLRRLKLHGLIKRIPGTFNWEVTNEGIKTALFVTKLCSRLFCTGLSETEETCTLKGGSKQNQAIKQLEKGVESLIATAQLS